MNSRHLIGLVCCGGKSSRMGSDKGLLMRAGKTWTENLLAVIQAAGLDYRISVRPEQMQAYSQFFPSSVLVEDDQKINVKGPALALLTAALHLPQDDLLVLACDLQQVQASLLNVLITHYHQHPEAEAIVFHHEGEVEPLCAIYTRQALARINQLAEERRLSSNSLKYLLGFVKVQAILLPDEYRQQIRNFNTPEDLETV
jgi:molybdopterin-guanine dinucleotide biosynthesis protein A